MLRCPLKMQGLYSNPSFLKSVVEQGGEFLVETIEKRPDLMKCDRSKCGFYSEYAEEYVIEVDAGNGKMREEARTRTVEGCGVALIPKQLAALTDAANDNGSEEVADAIDEAATEAEGLRVSVEQIGALIIGGLKIAADKYGMSDDLSALQASLEEAGDAGEADGEEDEDGDEGDDSEDEEEGPG